MICYGTRPEWIKVKPLVDERSESCRVLQIGQHTDLIDHSKVNNEFFLVKGTFGAVSPQSKYISFLNLHSRNPIGYGVVSPNDNIFKKDRKYNFIGYIKFDDYKKLIFNSHECKVEFQVPLSN